MILLRGHLIANSQLFRDALGNFKSRKRPRIRGLKIQDFLKFVVVFETLSFQENHWKARNSQSGAPGTAWPEFSPTASSGLVGRSWRCTVVMALPPEATYFNMLLKVVAVAIKIASWFQPWKASAPSVASKPVLVGMLCCAPEFCDQILPPVGVR